MPQTGPELPVRVSAQPAQHRCRGLTSSESARYIAVARPTCLTIQREAVCRTLSRAFAKTGKKTALNDTAKWTVSFSCLLGFSHPPAQSARSPMTSLAREEGVCTMKCAFA